MALTLEISVLFRFRHFRLNEFVAFGHSLLHKLLLAFTVGGGSSFLGFRCLLLGAIHLLLLGNFVFL